MGAKRPFSVIDAETDPFDGFTIPEPFVWGWYDGDRYEQFNDTDSLVAFLSGRKEIVYAHNGGRFDFHFLIDYVDSGSSVMLINGRIAKFKIGECEFRDSFLILPVALSVWEKDDFDYSILSREKRHLPGNMGRIEKYVHNDCIYLYNMVSAFIERFGRNLTIAGTAIKELQKRIGEDAPQSDAEFYDTFKPFYSGGRVECFQKGVRDVGFKTVDINSAYPFAMLHEHPFGLSWASFQGAKDKWHCVHNLNLENAGAYFFTIDATSRGGLPYRGDDKKLVFPNDDTVREFRVTGWELLAAMDTNTVRIKAVKEAIEFLHCRDFESYINPIYSERQEAKRAGDKAGDLFNKLLLNSAYGKFAADPRQYSKFKVFDPDYLDLMEQPKRGQDVDNFIYPIDQQLNRIVANQFRGELGRFFLMGEDLHESEQRFFNVATAASITGFVRAYMWRHICQCKGVIYCDTDSIAAEEIGFDNFSKELGAWEVEGEFDSFAVGGKKLYAFHYRGAGNKDTDFKTASKGVKFNAREIYDVARGRAVEYAPLAPTFSVFKQPTFNNRIVRAT